MEKKTIILVLNSFDKNYTAFVRPLLKDVNCKVVISNTVQTASQLAQFATDQRADGIIISGNDLLTKVLTLNGIVDEKPSRQMWEGSMLYLNEIPTIFVAPLEHLVSVPHAEFVMQRYITKITNPDKWFRTPDIMWELADTVGEADKIVELFSKALLVSSDIETVSMDIRCCGFSGLFVGEDKKLYSHTVVVPMVELWQYDLIKTLEELPTKKIFQNGNYDNTYLMRFDIKTSNYLFDTYHLMHSWYPELPKSLGFIAAFFMLDFKYWKYEANSHNLSDLYFYNAKDCHATLWSWVAMMQEMPDWAWANYCVEFPKVFTAISCGLDGFKLDDDKRQELRAKAVATADSNLKDLQTMIDEYFNPSSPKQVLALLHAFGYKEAKSSDENTLVKFADLHPINAMIVEKILEYRGEVKKIGTYFDFEVLNGRIMYKLDPAGTDSWRFASQQSNFAVTHVNTKGGFKYLHYGLQIQNVPVSVKEMFIPDNPDERIAEVDYSQSESRTTGYISEDETLINVVETSPDFHCTNASLFFGIPFEELYDVARHKKLNVPIRNLAKRTNHGANYCMGAWKLWQTMGDKNVRQAQRLLKLPSRWRPVQVCEYLLEQFEKTYPKIHGEYMQRMIREVHDTGMAVLPCLEFPMVRLTFLKPWENKLHRNSLMSFKPQALSGVKANDSYFKVWRKFQLEEKRIRMKAPIHDSLVFTYKEVDEAVVEEIREYMETPMTINGVVMRIPADAAKGAKNWYQTKD